MGAASWEKSGTCPGISWLSGFLARNMDDALVFRSRLGSPLWMKPCCSYVVIIVLHEKLSHVLPPLLFME